MPLSQNLKSCCQSVCVFVLCCFDHNRWRSAPSQPRPSAVYCHQVNRTSVLHGPMSDKLFPLQGILVCDGLRLTFQQLKHCVNHTAWTVLILETFRQRPTSCDLVSMKRCLLFYPMTQNPWKQMLCFQIDLKFTVPVLGMKLFHFPKVTLT